MYEREEKMTTEKKSVAINIIYINTEKMTLTHRQTKVMRSIRAIGSSMKQFTHSMLFHC